MKKILFVILAGFFSAAAFAQENKGPTSCKMALDNKAVNEITVETALAWCDVTPPAVMCDDGKIYLLESFQVNFLTLKPFQNKDFGIGEGGIPIMARNAIKNAQSGDTIILKEATYTDASGAKQTLPTISFRLK